MSQRLSTRGLAALPGVIGRLALSLLPLAAACGDDNAADDKARAEVVAQYVAVVRANYADMVKQADELDQALDSFVAAPSEDTLNSARKAWLSAREPYGQTEVFRFYEGPIDDPATGPEGRINGWPLDEVFIDYVKGDADSGMINNLKLFPKLTKELIAEQNERGGEKNISSGYHAIEFLLWGQDLSTEGPGARPYTDYVAGEEGALNSERRGQYLQLTSELLLEDLSFVAEAWSQEADSYASKLLDLSSDDALKRMIEGIEGMAGIELSGERMATAYTNGDQEDEHSCFSDNTLRDFTTNMLGIENVYFGRYGKLDGPGLDSLVAKVDKELDDRMQADIAAAMAAIAAIPGPFDQALLGKDSDPGRKQIKAAIDAIKQVNTTLAEISEALDL